MEPKCTRPGCGELREKHDAAAPHGFAETDCEGYLALRPCQSAPCLVATQSDDNLHDADDPHPRAEVSCAGYVADPSKPEGGGSFGGGGASGGW